MTNQTKHSKVIIIIIVILAIILAIFGGIIGYDIFKDKKNNGSGNGSKIDYTKKAFNEGTKITLTDGSKWYVLYSCEAEDEYITLLSVNDVNTDKVNYTQASNYLETTFKSKLVKGISSAQGDIQEIRLLTLDDIGLLSRIEPNMIIAGTSLENGVTSVFVYESESLIAAEENDLPLLICKPEANSDTNPGRVCVGTQTEVFPVRAVLKISKKYIKN